MSKKSKKKKTKLNEIIFKSYQDAINNRMKAGHDVHLMVNRLNSLIAKYS
jgi:pentose-5-phosphate-3-epimerase